MCARGHLAAAQGECGVCCRKRAFARWGVGRDGRGVGAGVRYRAAAAAVHGCVRACVRAWVVTVGVGRGWAAGVACPKGVWGWCDRAPCMCALRGTAAVARGHAELQKSPPEGVSVGLKDDNLFTWEVIIVGPSGTF